ncbi:nuclear transport factor 2 family protein [Sphingopyxis flava]|uniref:SnoaL-like domain-containing protein n=1 Tax=Sphingopyxis flava TaxID=1507287 RepID=A0A1T5G415_9SPHN|nr:nuclear transport factor 2 family protein [Sphingopyxis flava]SKC03176.1 SnoaL-like domain-containing protein [Sphingopyxis flava]
MDSLNSKGWPPERQRVSSFVGDVRPEGEAASVIHSIGMAEWHIGAEETNDVERVVKSLSEKNTLHARRNFDDPAYDILDTEYDQPRVRYRGSRDYSETVHSTSFRQVATDWYLFSERSWLVRPVTADETGRHVGEAYRAEGLVLVHTESDGIIGEMVLTRDAVAARPTAFPGLEADYTRDLETALHRHDALLAAYVDGNIDTILESFANDYSMLARNYFSPGPHAVDFKGSQEVRGHLSNMFSAVDVLGVTVLNRIVTEWYIFAEMDWRIRVKAPLEDSGAESGNVAHYRTTAMYRRSGNGRLAGELGYGTPIRTLPEAAK